MKRNTKDKTTAEQQFHKLDTIYFEIWSHAPSASGSYGRSAGWQAIRQSDKMLLDLNSLYVHKVLLGFSWSLMKV